MNTIIGTGQIHNRQYAGLWVRVQAFLLDYLIIISYLALIAVLGLTGNSFFPTITQALFSNPRAGQITGFVLITLPVTLYFALFESSIWQATLGKRWKKLKVITKNNMQLSAPRAIGRTLVKFIPWELTHTCIWQIRFASQEPSLPVMVGFVLVWILVGSNIVSLLFSPARQTLYDRLAGSFVVINNIV